MTAEPWCWGGGGVSHPSQLTTGLVIKSVTTSPTLAGERMLFILQVSILSEQTEVLPNFQKRQTRLIWLSQHLNSNARRDKFIEHQSSADDSSLCLPPMNVRILGGGVNPS